MAVSCLLVVGLGTTLLLQGGDGRGSVRIAGVRLDSTDAATRSALAARGRDLVLRTVEIRAQGRHIGAIRPYDLGARPLVATAVERAHAEAPGRLERSVRWLLREGPVEEPLPAAYRSGRLAAWIDGLAARLDRPARSGRVVVRGATIVVRPAAPGRRLDRRALRTLMTHDLAGIPEHLDLAFVTLLPRVPTDEAEREAAAGRAILDRPAAITAGSRHATLHAPALARALRFADGGATIDPEALRGPLERAFHAYVRPPRSATFIPEGSTVRLSPSRNGISLDAEAVARGLEGRSRPVSAPVVTTEPGLTTAEARGLGIRDLVGGYTTPFTPGEPRVTNVSRAAAILDGTIIRPGATLSLNATLGERTVGRGFVTAPMIAGSIEVPAVGGGVSQVATTLYNAAFLGGLDIVQRTAHALRIWRYPIGRDATISWGGPDLVIRNDWPASVLVHAAVSADAIAVALYSTSFDRRVDTTTGEPTDKTDPPTRLFEDESLRPKQKVLVQSGSPGFTIEVTRKVWRGDELLRDEVVSTTYQPEPKIYRVGTAVPGGEPPPVAPPEG